MKTTKLLPLLLGIIVIVSGCTSQYETIRLVKTLPEVSEFLEQYPNADIKAVLWKENVVEKKIDEIRKDCGEQVDIGRYWKVVISENNFNIIVWVDDETKEPFCIIKHETESTTTTTTSPITLTTTTIPPTTALETTISVTTTTVPTTNSCPYCDDPFSWDVRGCDVCFNSSLPYFGKAVLGSCLELSGMSKSNYYIYHQHTCTIEIGWSDDQKICGIPYYNRLTNHIQSSEPESQNLKGCWLTEYCGPVPAGCSSLDSCESSCKSQSYISGTCRFRYCQEKEYNIGQDNCAQLHSCCCSGKAEPQFSYGFAVCNAVDTIDEVITSTEQPYSITADSDYIYTAGYDFGSRDNSPRWKIEKRNKNTGELVTNFGNNGGVNVSIGRALSIANDENYLYTVGHVGTGYVWRIEKRDKITGELVDEFDGNIHNNPDPLGSPYSIAVDLDYIYIGGYTGHDYDRLSSGSWDWYIEKRDKNTGDVIWLQQSNPSTYMDQAKSLEIDSGYIYIVGEVDYDHWRIEKRGKSTGDLVIGFGDNGAINLEERWKADPLSVDPITIDERYLYVAMVDASERYQHHLKVKKYDKNTGSLIQDFGENGIVQIETEYTIFSDPSVIVDGNYIYLISEAANSGSTKANSIWLIEKRDKTTGDLIWQKRSNPTPHPDKPVSIVDDSGNIYIAGYDNINYQEIPYSGGGGYSTLWDTEWRIEKRDKTTGNLVRGFSDDNCFDYPNRS